MKPPLSRNAQKLIVEFENVGVSNDAEVLSIRLSLGGRQVDTAIYTIDFTDTARDRFIVQNGRLSNLMKWGDGSPPIVRISEVDANGGTTTIFRGQVVAANPELDQSGERITYTARTDWHLLTDGLKDRVEVVCMPDVNDVDTTVANVVRGQIIFNPHVDGVALPNHHIDSMAPLAENGHPRSATVDELLAAGFVDYWTLADIVDYVLFSLNYNNDIAFARSPDLNELKAQLSTDPELVRHLVVDMSQPLPAVLDTILDGYGYAWYIDHNANNNRSEFAFLDRRGEAPWRPMYMHPYGSPLVVNAARPTAKSYSLQYDIVSGAANLFHVVHGGAVVEASFELYPAWAMGYDVLEAEDLVEDSAAMRGEPELKRVWRDFILNEWKGYREPLAQRGIDNAAGCVQLHTLLSRQNTDFIVDPTKDLIPIRRRFLPMLTLDDDGSPSGSGRGGAYIEWSTDGGTTWWPISGDDDGNNAFLPNDGSVSLLANECGIRFSGGDRPPEEMFYQRDVLNDTTGDRWWDALKFRVTACIQVDDQIVTTRTPTATLLTNYRRPHFQNQRNMRSAVVSIKSVNRTDILAGIRKSAEIDLTTQSLAEAQRMDEVYNLASCTGTITVEGIEGAAFWLGCLVTKFQGREVLFDISPEDVEPVRYPRVVSVEYRVPQQEAVLTLDTDRTLHVTGRGRRRNVGWVRPESGKLRK